MARDDPIETYLAAVPEPRRAQLTELRARIRAALPHAQESLRFKMPTYDGPAGMLCAFANQKRHMSLYLCNERLIEHVRAHLPKADVGKGCIRFRSLEDLPRHMVDEILRNLQTTMPSKDDTAGA